MKKTNLTKILLLLMFSFQISALILGMTFFVLELLGKEESVKEIVKFLS
jgi:hypothetical protein